jgi:aminoglycoside 6'-N-acetyltransferase
MMDADQAARQQTPLDPAPLRFRPLALADLPLLHRWLNEPAVARWYGAGPTYAAVEEKYAPRIAGETPTAPYLILYGDQPIGYIQTYRVADYPAYARYIGAADDASAWGIDLLIGANAYRGRGLGAAALRAFTQEIVFAQLGATACLIDPHPDNAVAIRAYTRAGFRFVRAVAADDSGEPAWLMRLAREAH